MMRMVDKCTDIEASARSSPILAAFFQRIGGPPEFTELSWVRQFLSHSDF